jgi:Flp pilus assembly protein TadG
MTHRVSSRQRLGRLRDEHGQVTAFVVTIFLALLLLAGLVIDGGLALAAKRRAINEAEAAARAGAQAIAIPTFRTSGNITLDPASARTAAHAYLAAAGHSGTVRVVGERVTVTVQITQQLQILGLAGLGHLTVTGQGTAVPEHGVEQAEP